MIRLHQKKSGNYMYIFIKNIIKKIKNNLKINLALINGLGLSVVYNKSTKNIEITIVCLLIKLYWANV